MPGQSEVPRVRTRTSSCSRLAAIVLAGLASAGVFSSQTKPIPDIPEALRTTLTDYLKTRALTPEAYVISKFRDHDIVILGEHHFIKHDAELVQSLIPLLYEAGVRDLGIEFGCHELQDRADTLVTAASFDEKLARWLMFQWGSYWPYVEYLALYRRAWELNRSLPPGAPKFRIVGLDYKPRWDLVTEDMPPERWRAVLFNGPRDAFMAGTITEEFLKKRKKALIYMGQYHASTRFKTPTYDFAKKAVTERFADSAGRLVRRRIGDRVFQICLHYPWASVAGPRAHDYPVDGIVDGLLSVLPSPRLGFDVAGSPFARLGDRQAVYAAGRKGFQFGDFCDGYITQKPFSQYEGCSVDPLFVTTDNLAEAVANLPTAAIKKKIKTVAQFLEKMRSDADFRRLYPDLQ